MSQWGAVQNSALHLCYAKRYGFCQCPEPGYQRYAYPWVRQSASKCLPLAELEGKMPLAADEVLLYPRRRRHSFYNMNDTNNDKLTPFAQKLRRNMTKEERHLWYDFLKLRPENFNRQKVIGKYIVDFYCAEAKLVIELDGSQHCEDAGMTYDAERDEYLRGLGLTVCRYSNLDVMRNFEGVCTDILIRLNNVFA